MIQFFGIASLSRRMRVTQHRAVSGDGQITDNISRQIAADVPQYSQSGSTNPQVPWKVELGRSMSEPRDKALMPPG